jgi:hypothetical protein
MYEKPRLNRVGDAQDVILGLGAFGADLDLTWMPQQDEYADDGQARN